MSPRRKTGLQSGLGEILERQTAPIEDRARQSKNLVERFREEPQPPPTTPSLLPPPTKYDTAPKRDFAKVANSISRDALPAGLFKGTSKKLYDALYQRTRGAIVPTREIQARQGDLMEWARMSHNTLRTHLRHLQMVGLVVRKWELGDNAGATYEVFIPDELTPSYHPLLPPPTTNQNLVGASSQNLLVGGGGQVDVKSITSENPKTSTKTNTNDDEGGKRKDEFLAFDSFVNAMTEATWEVTGKAPNASEQDKWREVADIITAELKTAASKTSTVSCVPAFLATHLRRRLASKPLVKERDNSLPVSQTAPTPVEPAPPAPEDEEEYMRIREELEGK